MSLIKALCTRRCSDGGPFVQLVSGVEIDLSRPDYSGVTIADVAHCLAKIARYNGNTRGFVSVAQHCVLCAEHAPAGQEWNCLMHDAPETITGDITAPMKALVPQLRGALKAIEEPFQAHFDFEHNAIVKQIDNRAAATEQRDVRGGAGRRSSAIPFDVRMYPVEWQVAEKQFFDAAVRYAPERIRRHLMGTPSWLA